MRYVEVNVSERRLPRNIAINPEAIAFFHADGTRATRVTLVNGESIRVLLTPSDLKQAIAVSSELPFRRS